MVDHSMLLTIAATFLLAGAVKGVIGMGLPTVSLGVLTALYNLPTAMALMLIPSFATNLWQAVTGGYLFLLLRRLWLFYLASVVTIWLGAQALRHLAHDWLAAGLGALLILYALLNLSGINLMTGRDAKRTVTDSAGYMSGQWQQRMAGAATGAINGILTGMTGSFVFPGVPYLQSLGLGRVQLLQSMGLLFTLSTIALAGAMSGNGLLSLSLGYYSFAGVLPAFAGMLLTRRLCRNLPERIFKRIFFMSLVLLGLVLLLKAVVN